jgi:hypothetical protein
MLNDGRASARKDRITTRMLGHLLTGMDSYRDITRDIASTPVMVIVVMVTRMAGGAMS